MFTTIDLNRTRNIRNFLFNFARMLGIRSRSRSRQIISRMPASAQ